MLLWCVRLVRTSLGVSVFVGCYYDRAAAPPFTHFAAAGAVGRHGADRADFTRLADVNIERRRFSDVDSGAEQSNQKKARVTLEDGGDEGSEWSDGSRVGAVGTTGGSEHGSAGSTVSLVL